MFSQTEKAVLWSVIAVWFVLDIVAWVIGHRSLRQ